MHHCKPRQLHARDMVGLCGGTQMLEPYSAAMSTRHARPVCVCTDVHVVQHCKNSAVKTRCQACLRTAKLPSLAPLQGRELEAEVQESKLYSDRLASLEADLEELRLAEAEARSRHQKHLTELEPLANRHKHHKVRVLQAETSRLTLSMLRGTVAVVCWDDATKLVFLVQRQHHTPTDVSSPGNACPVGRARAAGGQAGEPAGRAGHAAAAGGGEDARLRGPPR